MFLRENDELPNYDPEKSFRKPHTVKGRNLEKIEKRQRRNFDCFLLFKIRENLKVEHHHNLYHRERILKTSTLSCNEEKEEITKPPTR
jgi:hypothetical protein